MTSTKHFLTIIIICSSFLADSQAFVNGDLNGSVNFTNPPTSWMDVPDTDPASMANSAIEATVDILDATGPNVFGGVAGNPQASATFCSGLHASDNGAFLWHEGIMQTVNGFAIGNNYSISFYQAVVKQQNCVDPSGSWRVYVDGTLIGTTAISTSALSFDDINLVWDCRIVNFTATATTHTIKFLPWDDDPVLTNNGGVANGGLRMGIDQITFITPVDPTITPSGPYCLSEPSVNLTAVDPGGTWTGNGIINGASGTFDPSTAGIGTHEIVYSLPAGCGFVTDTIDITVVNGADAGWIAPTGLCPNSAPIDLNTFLTSGTPGGTWSGTGITGSMFDPSFGTSNIMYSVGAPPCDSDSSLTIIVNQLDNAGFTYPQTNYCLLDPNPTPNVTGILGGTFTINVGGSINSNTGELDLAGSGVGTYVITYTTNGPCPNSSTFNINITNGSDATITPSGPYCQSAAPVILTAASPGGTWSATCGACVDANTGSFDPGLAGAGTHTITYTILGACGDVQNTTIDVITSSNAAINPAGPFCDGNPSVFLTAADPGGTWSGNGIIDPTTGEFDPSTAGPGNHTITYTIAGPCGNQETTQIIVNNPLSVIAFVDQTICEGGNANLSALASGGDGNYSYNWLDDSGNPVGNTQAITVSPSVTTTYTVTVMDQCGSNIPSASVTVTVEPLPIIDFTSDLTTGCAPLTVNFTDNSLPVGTNCLWDFGDSFVSTDCGMTSHTFTSPGCYDVSLTITTASGCSSSATSVSMVCVSPDAVANFTSTPEVASIYDPSIEFLNNSANATNYIWDFGDGHGSTEIDPSHVYQEAGTYQVCLTAVNDENCNSTACQMITIEDEFLLYVPNAFTPNGIGINDYFYPVISGYQTDSYNMEIYNRWGELIFETNSVGNPWTGQDPSGQPAKSDVYVWKIKVKSTSSTVIRHYIGHVTLLR